MKITLTGYGILKNYAGTPEKPYEYETPSPKPVKEIIQEMGIPQGLVMLISVNDEQKDLEYIPKDGDDIKFIPPIGGG